MLPKLQRLKKNLTDLERHEAVLRAQIAGYEKQVTDIADELTTLGIDPLHLVEETAGLTAEITELTSTINLQMEKLSDALNVL